MARGSKKDWSVLQGNIFTLGAFRTLMQTKVLWTELIDESASLSENYQFNWARIFANVNRKNLDQVDGKGNALVYTVGIKQRSTGVGGALGVSTEIKTASNGYATARAVKAWHRAWRKMLRREGITLKQLGKYGRTLRFPLTASDSYDNTLISGEYTHTSIAVESPQDADSTTALESDDMIDTYSLTLTGDSVAETPEAGETQYSSVGIIDSWLKARRKIGGPDTDGSDETVIDHENNPLYNLTSGSMASEEVLEIVSDMQKEEPPYSADAHDALFAQARLYSSSQSGDYAVVQCPAGLMDATIVSQNSDASTLTDVTVEWEIELLDVSPMVA